MLSFDNDTTYYSVAGVPQSYLTGGEGYIGKDYHSYSKHEN